nr:PREDICTED: cytochrome c oxidase subunit 7C, mitochondrial [Struthio camelus australis]
MRKQLKYLIGCKIKISFLFQNIPFSIENKWRLLAVMCAFFGSGFVFPFVIVRHQLLKK